MEPSLSPELGFTAMSSAFAEASLPANLDIQKEADSHHQSQSPVILPQAVGLEPKTREFTRAMALKLLLLRKYPSRLFCGRFWSKQERAKLQMMVTSPFSRSLHRHMWLDIDHTLLLHFSNAQRRRGLAP